MHSYCGCVLLSMYVALRISLCGWPTYIRSGRSGGLRAPMADSRRLAGVVPPALDVCRCLVFVAV